MNSALIWVMRADLTQRAQQKSYLMTLLIASLLTLFCFPDLTASYQVVEISGYRGVYNSAWMGSTLALLSVIFLPLFCFYLVKNAIEKDRQAGIGELVAATCVSKSSYLLGKLLSSVVLLVGLSIAITLVAILMQLWIGEYYIIEPFAFLIPQLVFIFPVIVLIAACALFFETVPFLRGGLGNIVYFFLWVSLIVDSIAGSAGVSAIMAQMEQEVLAIDPDIASLDRHVGISKQSGAQLNTFVWEGITYTPEMFTTSGFVLLIALTFFVISIFTFDRFRHQAKQKKPSWLNQKLGASLSKLYGPINQFTAQLASKNTHAHIVYMEAVLFLKGQPLFLSAAFLPLIVTQLLVGEQVMTAVIIPCTVLVGALVISSLGLQESKNRVQGLLISYPLSAQQQLIYKLMAAVGLVIIMLSGAMVRYLLSGEFMALSVLLVGVAFMVMLALICGVMTKTSRMFEITFVLMWYLGPIQPESYLDFLGSNLSYSLLNGLPISYLIAAVVLGLVAILWRKRQMAQGW